MSVEAPATLSRRAVILWCAIFAATFVWSAIAPHDRATWWLEVAPALLALGILAATARRAPLTPLVYWLVLVHCIVLMVGGHYTYAEVPLFDALRELFGWERNNYDKLGHLAQGFVPAMVAREVLLRATTLRRGWLVAMVLCVCLAISAFYELIEWWVALASEEAADAFLGTQGYVWDTQSDMMFALIGASTALLLLSRWHDAALRRHGLATP